VRDPEHNYVAAIGGNRQNYQRYTVKVEGREESIYYIVSGGGGGHVTATHTIPKIELPGVTEDDFVCYPRRGDSLCLYSNLYERRLGFSRGWFKIPPDEAAAYVAKRLEIPPTRFDDRITFDNGLTDVYARSRADRAAEKVRPLLARDRSLLHLLVRESLPWNEFPFFKHFLRLDASEGLLRIRCYAVTGCEETESTSPVEGDVSIKLNP
jgi:hypothetical protein